jgi:two-component system, sensor histidine kinase YesM
VPQVKKLYYRLTLRRRLWLAFLLLAVLSSALTGYTSYWIAYRSTEQEAAVSSQNTLNKSAQLLNEKLRNVVVSTSSMMLSEPFKDAMYDVYGNVTGTYYKRLSALQIPLAQMKLTDQSIHSVLIVTPIGELYATNDLRNTGVSLGSTLFGPLLKGEERVQWVEGHKDPLFLGNSRVISLLMKPVTDINVRDVEVLVNIKEDSLRSIVSDDLPGGGSGYYLISCTTGRPVLDIGAGTETFPENTGLLESLKTSDRGFLKHQIGKKTSLLNYARLDLANDWVMVSIQDQDLLLKQVNKIKTTSLLIMLACTLAALVAANGISGFLLKPLIRLQGMMKQVENNNLEVRFSSKFDDEVTQVGHKFNRMLEEIASLIDEVKAVEADKRRMEIKALQAQIDPHFLYNTLNTMIWKSVSSRNEEVTEMISSLSLLFQLGLNGGNEMTTLDKELEHVRHYLNLQQQCYKGLFEYTIEVEDGSLLELAVAKIIIQPLVENSILHGFQEGGKDGRIRVSVRKAGSNLLIEVEDNGKGMDAQAAAAQMQLSGPVRKSYALHNVYGRLKLLHGDNADLLFTSTPYQSTKAVITIPIEEGSA